MADANLCEFDKKLAESAQMSVDVGGGPIRIKFQFPPKIISDVNTSNWFEVESWSIEPVRIHSGSQGRKIVVEWEYIATNNSEFTGTKIAKILRNLKTYFFEFKHNFYPIVKLSYMQVCPEAINFRLRDASINHGPEIVATGSDYYPLYTKVSTVLELATNLNVNDREEAKMKVKPIDMGSVKRDWY